MKVEIDWSKAPEWAGAVVRSEIGNLFWVEQFGTKSRRQRLGNSEPDGDLVADMTQEWHGWRLVENRPKAWAGEGLPPVGTRLEWLSEQYGWLGGRVVGHDGTVTVVVHNDGYTGCHPHEVRPIRTPEQIAAEEREKAIEAIVGDILRNTRKEVWCCATTLYDAGYRKVQP